MKSITMSPSRSEAVAKNLLAAHGSAVNVLRVFHTGAALEFPNGVDAVSLLIVLNGIAIIELADTQHKEPKT